ncbi:MAG: hypothetical protein P9L94_08605 [Candidatus Hinthialibacter antarcticus]|nr:hypothetical protein [Candidatus Hinthialibacter antarcticus]
MIFEESDGLASIEAEHYVSHDLNSVRFWYTVTPQNPMGIEPDGDGNHAESASGGAYLELLPDTRRTHDDPLISGENFSNTPGQLAILTYKVRFKTPGRYYVWVRAFSTGPEDNGIHVGLDGLWPETGRRMQWCVGKNDWRWESKQRTQENHCGEPYKIYLDINEPGLHSIAFSMREDGFEFDKFVLTIDREYTPKGMGPDASSKTD